LPEVIARGDDAAQVLARRLHRFELCAITCSYDTAFEPVEQQMRDKLEELARVFPPDGPVKLSLVVVDDAGDRGFRDAVLRAFEDAPLPRSRLSVFPLRSGTPDLWGRRAIATREALLHALHLTPDAVLQINLNLKVHAAQAATGLELLTRTGAAAAIGSRAWRDGGDQQGAGLIGRGKSLAYNHLVAGALPALADFRDIGSPMKLLSLRAATLISRLSRLSDVGYEVEWLQILMANGLAAPRFGILWQQRAGSRPPFEKSLGMFADIRSVRRANARGALSS